MPIHCPLQLPPVSDMDFGAVDQVVIGCCFASQNHLGRLCDERVYENDVAARLRARGIEVHTQLPVTVTHESFTKGYRLDLVVRRIVYELKTAAAFAPDHKAQAIHYAALTGTDRVKLINFHTPRVKGWLVRSPLWSVNRREFTIDQSRWQSLSQSCEVVLRRMTALLGDWGAFLEAELYQEALIHFVGGESRCIRRLPVTREGLNLGTHRIVCHDAEVGLVLTAFSKEAAAYEAQLRRLLSCLPLRGLQWLNLNHSELQAVTVIQGKGMEAKESVNPSHGFNRNSAPRKSGLPCCR